MKLKRILTILLAACTLIGSMPAIAFAEENVAYYFDGSNYTYFTDASKAWKTAVDNNGTFGLLADWDDGRRKISDGKKVTVELNGHVLTRRKGKWANDGEVFYVGKNATLTVYGGTKDNPELGSGTKHVEKAYVADPDDRDFHRQDVTFYGGLIHGGNSSNGAGGIHMKKGARVNLYYTTVAGNRAEQTWNSDGYGGGVKFDGSDCYLFMDHSTISYNYAYNDGGGVYMDEGSERCAIEMVKSHIDHNVADDNGAGIYVGGENFRLIGDAKQVMEPESVTDWDDEALGSSVSYNYLVDSDWYAGGGGGLHLYDDIAYVRGINFVGNYADGNGDYGGDGGAIFIREETVTIRECNIINNRANILGGGINNYNDFNTIDSCTIYGNQADDSGGGGGGVYTEKYNDITLAGTTIIRGNRSKSYDQDNMYLPGFGTYATNAFIIPALKNGADVHIRIGSTHKRDQLSTFGTFRDDFYTYDNNPDQYIAWDRDTHYLAVESGTKPQTPQEVFHPDSGKRTQSVQGGYTVNGRTYELVKGVTGFWTTDNTERDFTTVFYYTDGYFMEDPMEYNYHLATMSCILNGAGGNSNDYGWGEDPMMYVDKSHNFRQLMSDIGIRDEDIYINDFYSLKPETDSIGVGLANKTLPDGTTLVIVSVRSLGYEAEWVSNFTLGAVEEAEGFSSSATQVMAELGAYLERYGIDGTSDDVKFWITGYSRGGAVANLVSKRVVDDYDTDGTRIFAYPIAVPKGGLESEAIPGNNYNCIHNTINQNDLITYLGTTEMGLIRYGVDHFVPGDTDSSTTFTDTDNNNVPEDNRPWDVGKGSYPEYLDKMLKQAAAVAPELVFDDYFHRATINYVTGAALKNFGWKMIDETTNGGWSTESFIPLFMKKLQEYALNYGEEGDYRGTYAGVEVSNGRTFQQALALLVRLAFCKSPEDLEGITKTFGDLINRLDTSELAGAYLAVRKYATAEIMTSSVSFRGLSDTIWKKLTKLSTEDEAAGYHAISEYLTEEEMLELQSCFPALMLPILELVAQDYANHDQDLLGTMAYNAVNLVTNHYPETMIAWLRTYDSFFENDLAIVEMDPSVKKAPGTVAVSITDPEGNTRIVTGDTVEVDPNDKISILTVDSSGAGNRDLGEAVYYKINSPEYRIDYWRALSQPVHVKELFDKYGDGGKVELELMPMHYSQHADRQTQTLTLQILDISHYEVPVSFSDSDGYTYSTVKVPIGDTTELKGVRPGYTARFTGWTVYDVSGDTPVKVGAQDYARLFGEQFDPTAENTVLESSGTGNYRFEPGYIRVVDYIRLSMSKLPGNVTWSTTDYTSDEIPVGWTIRNGNQATASFSFSMPEGMELREGQNIQGDSPPVAFPWFSLKTYQAVTDADNTVTVTLTAEFTKDIQNNTDEFIKVIAANRSSGTTLGKTYFYKGMDSGSETMLIKAPAYPGMEFVQWQNLPPGTDALQEVIEIRKDLQGVNEYAALYRPVVNDLSLVLDNDITAGESLPLPKKLMAGGMNGFEIEDYDFSWVENDAKARNSTVYTAHITFDADAARGYAADDPSAAVFRFAENVTGRVRTNSGSSFQVTNSFFSIDENGMASLDIVFPATGKEKLVSVQKTSVTVPHNSTPADIEGLLPGNLFAYRTDKTPVYVGVLWTLNDPIDSSNPEAQILHASGTLVSGEYDAGGITADAVIHVLAAPKTGMPTASVESGTYTGTLNVALEAEEGARICYALPAYDEELDFADLENAEFSEYTEPIRLNQYGRHLYIAAYAEKDGLRQSDTVTWSYMLTKPEVDKLEEKPATITESGNIECWYSSKTVLHYDKDDETVISEEVVPDQYFADEGCTIPLDYHEDVVIPAFVKESHETTEEEDPNLAGLDSDDEVSYGGLELIGVQEIANSEDVRVLTVVDSDIIRDASDYGYLFTPEDYGDEESELTYENAEYRVSCKGTSNDMEDSYGSRNPSSTPYKYVTARINAAAYERPLQSVCFYVKLENGTEYIYSDTAAIIPGIGSSAVTDAVKDNIKMLGPGSDDPSGGGGGGSVTPPDDPTPPDGPGDEPCSRDESCPIFRFSDSDPKAWYHDGVHWALEEGVMNGTGETTFAPNASTSRAMIVTMLYRWEMKDGRGENSPISNLQSSNSFADVEAGSWYEAAVNWAAEGNIVNGYSENAFGPTDPVTREQLAAILYRYAEYRDDRGDNYAVDLSKFEDASAVSEWAQDAITWCVASGIISGVTETTLEPQGNATRAQVATMLMRYNNEKPEA